MESDNEKLNDKDLEEKPSYLGVTPYDTAGRSQCSYCGEMLPTYCRVHICGDEEQEQQDHYMDGFVETMRFLNVSTRKERKFTREIIPFDAEWKENDR